MLSMAAAQSLDDIYKILVVVCIFTGSLFLAAMFRAPIGKLLVRLESLQLPFLIARFTRDKTDGGPSGSEPPPLLRASDQGSSESLLTGDSPRIDSDVNRTASVGVSEGQVSGADSPP